MTQPGQPPSDTIRPHRTWWALGAGALVGLVAIAISACSVLTETRTNPRSDSIPTQTDAQRLYERYRLAAIAGEPIMRVRIERATDTATIAGPARITITHQPPDALETTFDLPTPVRVSLDQFAWTLTDSAGQTRRLPRAHAQSGPLDPAEHFSIEPSAPGALLTLNEAPLPGMIAIHARRDAAPNRFDVIEHVPIELYLPGVIAKELYLHWKPETFRAQAIAARSYALHERQRRLDLGHHFDIESTTSAQAYIGATEHDLSHLAVESTRGIVLTWQETILRAYYSSTTGGRAASARETWPILPGQEFNLAGPIQASPRDSSDSISPYFRWTVTRSTEDLLKRIRAYGEDRQNLFRKLPSITAITPIAFNEFERPTRYRIVDGEGKFWEIIAEELRLACNFPLPNNTVTTNKDRIPSSDFTVAIAADSAIFSGRGFGHGVGMSQFGAEAMARRGQRAEDILMHYYPGSQLERAY